MSTQYSFYTIIPEAFVYGKSKQSNELSTRSRSSILPEDVVEHNTTPYIVDSGTTLLYLPTGKTIHFAAQKRSVGTMDPKTER